ncbi:MAG: MarR family winged helix-turn-helix transcriptional regulator [Anaerofustis sp.]
MTDMQYNELLRAMQKLNRRMFRAMHRSMHESQGLYRGQRSALALLKEHDGASQRELAEWLDIRPSSVAELIGKLETKGYVRREQDGEDQRVMRIYLTEEGRSVLDGTIAEEDSLAAIFAPLSKEESEQLLALIEKLNSGMDDAEACDPFDAFRRGAGRRRDGHHFHGYGYAPQFNRACDRNCRKCKRPICVMDRGC